MMNSSINKEAQRIVQTIFRSLQEENLQRKIDRPIDKAAKQYPFPQTVEYTCQRLLQELGRFLNHIYLQTQTYTREMSEDQIQAEVMSLLERHFRIQSSTGFHAAILEATRIEEKPFEYLALQLTHILKQNRRMRYKNWIITQHASCSDWETQCAIVTLLIDQWKPYFPDWFQVSSPAQYVHLIPEFITMTLHNDNILQQIIRFES